MDPLPLVVSGAEHDAIAAAVAELRRTAGLRVEVVRNTAWRDGRSGSVRVAQEHRAGRDLCIAPVDVPLVPAAVFDALAGAWQRAGRPATGWLAPSTRPPGSTAGERFGHPVVVGRELAATLKGLPPDASLRTLRARAAPLLSVAVASIAVLDDLDSPSDLEALRERLRAARPGGDPSLH